MKAKVFILTAIFAIGSAAHAVDCPRGSDCNSSTMTGLASSFATTALGGLILITSQALANDIIATQDDVALALGAGVQSAELKSVVARIRHELGNSVAHLTDDELIAEMLLD